MNFSYKKGSYHEQEPLIVNFLVSDSNAKHNCLASPALPASEYLHYRSFP